MKERNHWGYWSVVQEVGYAQVLKYANDFMDDSGLRKFCQEICGGICCNGGDTDQKFDNYKCRQPVDCREKVTCVNYRCGKLHRIVGSALVDSTGDNLLLRLWRRLGSYAEAGEELFHELKVKHRSKTQKYFGSWGFPKEEMMEFRVEVRTNKYVRPIPVTVTRAIRRFIDQHWEMLSSNRGLWFD